MTSTLRTYPGRDWDHEAPRATDFDRELLDAAVSRAMRRCAAALTVVEGGRVVVAGGDQAAKFDIASGRKSLLSALYGIYIGEGVIDPSLTLAALDVDDFDPLTDVERQATIRDLLMSRSGVYRPAAKATLRMRIQRPRRGSYLPGDHWYYNNWDFNTLGTIFEQLVGASVHEAFQERIARPLGMQDYSPADGHYVSTKRSKHRAYRFVMSARDLARFGLLYARHGRWLDHQIVPADWIADSTAAHTPEAQGGLGYGYSWWVGRPDDLDGHNFYILRGGIGHAVLIVPDLDVVVVHRVRVGPLTRRLQLHAFIGWQVYWRRIGPHRRRLLPPTTLNAVVDAVATEPAPPRTPHP
jgi:CubicO group peptidase (beta-lactamase class C family)